MFGFEFMRIVDRFWNCLCAKQDTVQVILVQSFKLIYVDKKNNLGSFYCKI